MPLTIEFKRDPAVLTIVPAVAWAAAHRCMDCHMVVEPSVTGACPICQSSALLNLSAVLDRMEES